MDENTDSKLLGRRHFLKSLFGLTAVGEQRAESRASARPTSNFFWCNLRNGQIAFPSGMTVPAGQPGSVMKLVSAAALHEAGMYSHGETIECRGEVEIRHHSYKCLYAHGNVDLVRALGLSCNVFFAEALQHLTPVAVIEYARKLGLDTPVDGFNARQFPQKAIGDTAQYGLGLAEDLQPNALQLMRLAGLVALGGTLPPLHNAAEPPAAAEAMHVELSAATWQLLQRGMRICEREGTARKLDPEDALKIAAKTGTAPHGKSFQSWLIGYFPFDSAPRHAFCLRSQSGTSQDSAVPAAHKFLFAAPWP